MSQPNFRAAREWQEERDRSVKPGRALSRRAVERPLDLQDAAHEHTIDEMDRMELRLAVLHERAVVLEMRLSAEVIGRTLDTLRLARRAYLSEVPAQGTAAQRRAAANTRE
jgi:hypothetical protein